jgi:hypothetical protein
MRTFGCGFVEFTVAVRPVFGNCVGRSTKRFGRGPELVLIVNCKFAVVPEVMEMLGGEAVSWNAGALTATVKLVELVSVPLVPVRLRVLLPSAADGEAEMLTPCDPPAAIE